MLRDRLVCGIRDKAVQRRLLREADLTFDKALDAALAAETAERYPRRLTENGPGTSEKNHNTPLPTAIQKVKKPQESSTVNRVDRPKQYHPIQRKSGPSRDQSCYRCGGKHHPTRCTFKDYECHNCKKRGHLARMCRKKAHSKPEQTRSEQANVVSEGGEKSEEC